MPRRPLVAKKPFQQDGEAEPPSAPRAKRGRPSTKATAPPLPPAKKQRVTRANASAKQDLSVLSIEEVVKRSNAALNKAKRPTTRPRGTRRGTAAQDKPDEDEDEDDQAESGDGAEEIQVAAEEENEAVDDAEEQEEDTSSRLAKRQLASEMLTTPGAWGNLGDRHRARVPHKSAAGRSIGQTWQGVNSDPYTMFSPENRAGRAGGLPVTGSKKQLSISRTTVDRSRGAVQGQQAVESKLSLSDNEDEQDGEEEVETARSQDTVLLDISALRKLSFLMSHAAWTGDQRWEHSMLENHDGPNSGLGQLIRRRLNQLADLLRDAPRPKDPSQYDFSEQTSYLEANGTKLGRIYERVKDCVDRICKDRLGPFGSEQNLANSADLRHEMMELLFQDIVPLIIHVLKTACTLGGHNEDPEHALIPRPLSPGTFTNPGLGIVNQISEWLLRVQKALLNELHREEAAKQDEDLDEDEDLQATEEKTQRFALEPLAKQFRTTIRHAQDELDERLREPARLRVAAQRDAEIKASRAADEEREVQDAISHRRAVAQSSQALRTMVNPLHARYQKIMGNCYSMSGVPASAIVKPPAEAPRPVVEPLQERYKEVLGSRYSTTGHSAAAPPPRAVLPPSPRPVFELPPDEANPVDEDSGDMGHWTDAELDFLKEELQKGAARDMELVARRLGRPFVDIINRAAQERKAKRDECKVKHSKIPEWAQEPHRASKGGKR